MTSPDRPAPHSPPPADPQDRPGSSPTHGPTRVGAAPEAPGSSPRDGGRALPMPHERDEAPGQTSARPDPVIHQAKKDLDAGLVDTDMRATPGLDAERRDELVPGPEADPTGNAVGRGRHDEHRPTDRPGPRR